MHALLIALALSVAPEARSKAEEADDVVQKAFADVPEGKTPAAAAESASAPAGKMFGWGLALIAVASVVALAMKRKSQRQEDGYAQLSQNLSVGPKRSLLVVSFGGKRMLVGSTEAGFTVLSSEAIAPPAPVKSDFEELIEQQLDAISSAGSVANRGDA